MSGGGDDVLLAYFTVDTDYGAAPLTVTFEESSEGDIASYEWDFDGDGITDSTAPSPPSHTYQQAGTYEAALTITGVSGTSDTYTYPIFMVAPLPSATPTSTVLPSLTPTHTLTVSEPTVTWPTGTVTTGVGDMTFVWKAPAGGAIAYELHVAEAGGDERFFGTVTAAQAGCDMDTICEFNPTMVNIDALLTANGEHVWWLRAEHSAGVFTPWVGPNTFTLTIPAPGLVASGSMTTDTLTPTFSFDIGDAEEASYFRLYLQGEDGTIPVNNVWFTRADLCGSFAGTSCTYIMPTALVDGVEYTLYVQSYGPGGTSTGGTDGYRTVVTDTIRLP